MTITSDSIIYGRAPNGTKDPFYSVHFHIIAFLSLRHMFLWISRGIIVKLIVLVFSIRSPKISVTINIKNLGVHLIHEHVVFQ